MPLIFLALFLVFTTSVSAQTPLVPPALFAAPGAQTPLAAASDGSNFLVIWSDTRPAAGLYAARVSSDGTVVDRAGILVAPAPVFRATVLWDGRTYAILWEDPAGIRERHVRPDGTMDAALTLVAQGHTSTSRFAAVAATGAIAVVHDAAVSVTESSGSAVINTQPIANATSMSVAAIGNDFLVAWVGDNSSINAQHYATDGFAKIEAFTVTGANSDAASPLVFGGGNQYILLSVGPTIDARIILLNGLASAPITLGTGSSPTAAAVSNGFAVAFVSGSSVVSRIVTNGSATAPVTVTNSGQSPQLAWNGSDIFAAWADRTASRDVNAVILGRTAPVRISSAAPDQTQASIAYGGVYGVAWTETQSDGATPNVFFERLASNGVVVDAHPLALGAPGTVNDSPSIAFNGTNFVVAWLEHSGATSTLVVDRIATSGTLLDPPLRIPNVCSAPSVAANSLGTAIVYVDCDQTTLRLTRISATGGGATTQVTQPGGRVASPKVAASNDQYMVIWQGDAFLLGARVTPFSQLLDTTPLLITTSAANASIGSNGTDFLAAWESLDFIWTRHINRNGNFTTPAIAVTPGRLPHVTTEGDAFAITFIRDGVGYIHDEGGDERVIAASANDVTFLATSSGKATLYTTVVRDAASGGVDRAFVAVTGTQPPGRHRAVRK